MVSLPSQKINDPDTSLALFQPFHGILRHLSLILPVSLGMPHNRPTLPTEALTMHIWGVYSKIVMAQTRAEDRVMRTVFAENCTRRMAAREYPWAALIVKVEGGYLCFESVVDYETWKKQK